jgi:hypothetical protein
MKAMTRMPKRSSFLCIAAKTPEAAKEMVPKISINLSKSNFMANNEDIGFGLQLKQNIPFVLAGDATSPGLQRKKQRSQGRYRKEKSGGFKIQLSH